ncbi:MAG: hypothetical protein ACJ797_03250, partial [Ktedonobacteraceae bacterium]
LQQQGGVLGGGGAASGAAKRPADGGLPELLSPGDIANALKVSEGDVLAILESGDLPGNVSMH